MLILGHLPLKCLTLIPFAYGGQIKAYFGVLKSRSVTDKKHLHLL